MGSLGEVRLRQDLLNEDGTEKGGGVGFASLVFSASAIITLLRH